jgi:hypothetical protein
MVSVGQSDLGEDKFEKDKFEKAKKKIEKDTEKSTRSFVRTWFIRSFPEDLPGDDEFNSYFGLTRQLQSKHLLCDTGGTGNSVSNTYCKALKEYVEGTVRTDIDKYLVETSIVVVNNFIAPELILSRVAHYVSLGGSKDDEQNNDTCSIITKSTDANFNKELNKILGSTENLVIGELPDIIKGGLKMRKNRKTRKIRKFRKTKKIRKMNKKRKTTQSKRKKKY